MPVFGYGCAVFMQSDIVNFQRQGWRAEEILAGLAAVLPKNVFLYVASIPNLAAFGSRFILQGGTQNNLAVVKAEVDFIRNSFRAAGQRPEIIVHEHCGESGAIGAAVEVLRVWRQGLRTSFIGLDAVRQIEYRTTRNEDTRCNFCKNTCLRTFIDIRTEALLPLPVTPSKPRVSKVPLRPDEQRLIIATCEKGAVEDLNEMKEIKAGLDQIREANPNFVDLAAREVFRPRNPKSVADPIPSRAWTRAARVRLALQLSRRELRIGVPRVLNAYAYAPLFNAYLESLGVQPENIVYSDYTSPELYRAGSSRGAIDPCFPAKVAISHVYNLIQVKHRKNPLDAIFFPMYDVLHSPLVQLTGVNACPTVTATPATVKAAFTKENNLFAEINVKYVDPILNLTDRKLFAFQMLQAWGPILGVSQEENERAIAAGYKALEDYEASIRRRARQALDQLEREDRIGIVVLGRPYHHDPGLNHEIFDEFQKLGYPIFSQNTLPLDEDMLERLFGEEVRAGATIVSLFYALGQPAALSVDGQQILSDVPPVTSAGRAYVPIRAVAEGLGGMTSYDSKSGNVVVIRGSDVLRMKIGSVHAKLNGNTMTLKHPPFVVRGRAMVGLNVVKRAFGSMVAYNRRGRTIDVSTPGVIDAGAQEVR